MGLLRKTLGWFIAIMTVLWRWSCRLEHHGKSREPLLNKEQPFIIALLHAHMITGILGASPRAIVMASRSADGDLIAPSIRLAGMRPVRGSSKKDNQDKGGTEALSQMKKLLEEQSYNPILTVDGPRGPRNYVHRGVASLAIEFGCPVIPLTPLASRYKTLPNTWDRTQVPLPFGTIHMHWGEPLYPTASESIDSFRKRVGEALRESELLLNEVEAKKFSSEQIRFI